MDYPAHRTFLPNIAITFPAQLAQQKMPENTPENITQPPPSLRGCTYLLSVHLDLTFSVTDRSLTPSTVRYEIHSRIHRTTRRINVVVIIPYRSSEYPSPLKKFTRSQLTPTVPHKKEHHPRLAIPHTISFTQIQVKHQCSHTPDPLLSSP